MNSLKDALPATITTDRLVLTTPTLAHVPAIARLANNHQVHRWMARLPFPYAEEDARFFIEEIVPQAEECSYAILLNGVTLAGVVGLRCIHGEMPMLGYWLGQEHWGKGYATEAALALVGAARSTGIAGLQSRALVENSGSRNVLRKAGFVETGEAVEPDNNLAGRQMMLMRLDFDR